jgi:probable HAF family extracellular repeat protein
MTLFGSLAIPVRLAAQEQKVEKGHHRYKLIDLGTFGGPASYFSGGGIGNLVLNNEGIVAGYADTSAPDPYAPNCFNPDCFLSHTFRWQNGVLTDLGALPGTNSSAASGINSRGWIAGYSENGVIDPLTGFPETNAALWKDGQIINLGTLGGNESLAISVKDGGQVVGLATINRTPDPFSFLGAPTHTFIWQNGVMRDLGTLGGPDSFPSAGGINERIRLVAGGSYTNSAPNAVATPCGQGVPTMDPFLWDSGTMIDLGTLGGTCGFSVGVNNRGQVVGQSDLVGDLTAHPFLWDRGVLTDLGTLGGTFGRANWINDAGEIVGGATNQGDQAFLAFLWKDGVMTDLGTLTGDCLSEAVAINSKGQVVGYSFSCASNTQRSFLWDDGQMIDLDTLIPHSSSLQLLEGLNINDRGEILGVGVPPGVPPNTDLFGHQFLLIPCDRDHSDVEGCQDEGEGIAVATQPSSAPVTRPSATTQGRLTPGMLASLRARLPRPYHIPGIAGSPRD